MTDADLKKCIEDIYFYREDGRLCWKVESGYHKAGQVAGWQSTAHNYRTVGLGRKSAKRHLAEHRAIFLLHFGRLPTMVDHINGESLDNRIENLRASDAQENAYNRKLQSNNTSGCKGVHLIKSTGKWRATIRSKGEYINLGVHIDKADAVKARQIAEKHYYGDLRRR